MTLPRRAELMRLGVAMAVLALRPSLTRAACEGPALRVEAQLGDAWQPALAELAQRMRNTPGVDPCSVVRLLDMPGGLTVRVELNDGRATERRVESPELLVATVESLIWPLPVAAAPSPPPVAPAPAREPALAPVATPSPGLELGVGPSLRLAGSPRYIGYGVSAYLQMLVGAFSIGTWTRWDLRDQALQQRQFNTDFDDATSFLLGAYAGYRVLRAPVVLEAQLGPNVVVGHRAARSGNGSDGGAAFGDVSVGAALRLATPHENGKNPDLYGALVGELFPRRLIDSQSSTDLLPLPAWSGTLVLGFSWRLL